MASVMVYRGYTHTDNECNLDSFSKQTGFSQRKKRLTTTKTMRISGELIYPTQAQIISKAQEIVNAYSTDYGNATYSVAGGTAHNLLNSGDCQSGVRVVYTSFPKGDAAELATTRTFTVVLQATYDDAEDDLVWWEESITKVGNGGPKFFVVDTVTIPIAAYVSQSTAVYYHQTGRAIGYSTYPAYPGPFTGLEIGERRRITFGSAKQMGNGLRFWPVNWSYTMVRDITTFGDVSITPTSK